MTAVGERTLPHNLDAEKAVLGAVLLKSELYSEVALRLRTQDFFRSAHAAIFRAMGLMADRSCAIDTITILDELTRNGVLDDVGGPAYVASLTDGVPRAANIDHYAGIVREKARLRAIAASANQLLAAAYEAEESAARLVERAQAALGRVIDVEGAQTVTAREAMLNYASAIERGEVGPGLATGYADLDELIGGLKPADFAIVAARPSVGKTSWALGLGRNIATAGFVTVFFSLEMSQQATAARLLSSSSRVSAQRLERGVVSEDDYQRIAEALAAADIPLHIEETAGTVAEVRAWCRRFRQAGAPPACVIVDYLQLLSPDRRRESDEAEVSGVSRALKKLAKDEKCAVVALSQLSRALEGRRDKRPQMSDLRGSGALEQDCDLGILLYRGALYHPTEENNGIAEVIVAKNRNGPTGVIKMAFIEEYAAFLDLEWRT